MMLFLKKEYVGYQNACEKYKSELLKLFWYCVVEKQEKRRVVYIEVLFNKLKIRIENETTPTMQSSGGSDQKIGEIECENANFVYVQVSEQLIECTKWDGFIPPHKNGCINPYFTNKIDWAAEQGREEPIYYAGTVRNLRIDLYPCFQNWKTVLQVAAYKNPYTIYFISSGNGVGEGRGMQG